MKRKFEDMSKNLMKGNVDNKLNSYVDVFKKKDLNFKHVHVNEGDFLFFRGDALHMNLSYRHQCAVLHLDADIKRDINQFDGTGTEKSPNDFWSYIVKENEVKYIVPQPFNYSEILELDNQLNGIQLV